MNSDQERTFHLNDDDLLSAVIDGKLTSQKRQQLELRLQTNEAFRQKYLEYVEVEALLRYRTGNKGQELIATPHRSRLLSPAPDSPVRMLGLTAAVSAAMFLAFVVIARNTNKEGAATIVEHAAGATFMKEGRLLTPLDPIQVKEMEDGAIWLRRGTLMVTGSNRKKSSRSVTRSLTIRTTAGVVRVPARGRFVVKASAAPAADRKAVRSSRVKPSVTLMVLYGAAVLANGGDSITADSGDVLSSLKDGQPEKLIDEGYYREALELLEKLIVSPEFQGEACASAIRRTTRCLQSLGRYEWFDELAEKVVATHQSDWHVLNEIALRYLQAPSHGVMIEERFLRDETGGRQINVAERDRIRALQLLLKAKEVAPVEAPDAIDQIYGNLQRALESHRGRWNLQRLTKIHELPAYGDPVFVSNQSEPAVDENGDPIFYSVPASWEQSRNDGERWRWLLAQRFALRPDRALALKLELAQQLRSHFGVHTAGHIGEVQLEEGEIPLDGPYSVHTLGRDETIARLANGIRRFDLPLEQQYIRMLEEVAEAPLLFKRAELSDVGYGAYLGSWDRLPDLMALPLDATGEVPSGLFDLAVAPRKDNYALMFSGHLFVSEAGTYEFEVESDDGSRLFVNGQVVIDHDGVHSRISKRGTVELEPGLQTLRLDYFQHQGNDGLVVSYKAPNGKRFYLSKELPRSEQQTAREQLANIYENRRQFSEAAMQWKKCIDQFGTGDRRHRQDHLEQIIGNWGRLTPPDIIAAGQENAIELAFRNAQRVRFRAQRIKLESYFEWIKQELKANADEAQHNAHQLFAVADAIVRDEKRQYLEDEEVTWTASLDPPSGHWMRKVRIDTPLREAGAYLVEAEIENGNRARVVCWLTNTTVAMKPIDNGQLYYVADTLSGRPIPSANVEVFAYRRWHDETQNRELIETVNFSRITDSNGLARSSNDDMHDSSFQSVVVARDVNSGRLGILGDFIRVRTRELDRTPHGPVKAWCTTDRPAYRPEQTVHIKSWVRRPQYDVGDVSVFGGRTFQLKVTDSRNNELLNQQLVADEFGGIDAHLKLESDVTLGQVRAAIYELNQNENENERQQQLGQTTFRVEAYRRPEFEVKIEASEKPIRLGDRIRASIRADYFFGEPVRNAQVSYSVTRNVRFDRWFPPQPWDWCYGSGFWWWGYDYQWYPGISTWGHSTINWRGYQASNEVIEKKTVPIGVDGTVDVEIDTATTLDHFGNVDHEFTVHAEVVDRSGRSVSGSGSVIALRQPFQVIVWTDRGHTRVHETLDVLVKARTPNRDVQGTGEATLYRVTFDDRGTPIETEFDRLELELEADGSGRVRFEPKQAGLYRIECNIVNQAGAKVTGATLTRVLDRNLRPADDDQGFNDLEIVLDKATYKPGETAQLLISSKHRNQTVLLFLRPRGGVYPEPQSIELEGHATLYSLPIVPQDLPNLHVEAMAIVKGRTIHANKEIAVPPQSRILNLEVVANKTKFEPGQQAKLRLRVTDQHDRPVQGSTVLTVYDESLESIAASRTAALTKFYWNWRRRHNRNTVALQSNPFGTPALPNELTMRTLGTDANHIRFGRGEGVYFAAAERYRFASRDFSLFGDGPLVQDRFKGVAAARALGANTILGKRFVPLSIREGGNASPTIRTNFAETAYWSEHLLTDSKGEATVEFPLPDSLTRWKVKAWSMAHGTRVGEGELDLVTSKDLLVRLQTPRFLVKGDEVMVTANVHNYSGQTKRLHVSLEADQELTVAENAPLEQTMTVASRSDERIQWKLRAEEMGMPRLMARIEDGQGNGDAMARSIPVLSRGFLKTESFSRVAEFEDDKCVLDFTVPHNVAPNRTTIDLRYSPSVAASVVDALPYLVANSEKNSEAFTSQLLPLIAARRMLNELGVELDDLSKVRNNLNSQEVVANSEGSGRNESFNGHHTSNPLFDHAEFVRRVNGCLRHLNAGQNRDGGWGWYPGHSSSAHATAYVVNGLLAARAGELPIVPGTLDRGLQWLHQHQQRELKRLQAWVEQRRESKSTVAESDVLVLSVLARAGKVDAAMVDFVFRDRLKLSHQSLARLATVLHQLGDVQRMGRVIRILEQFQMVDEENQTAYLRSAHRHWWQWYGNEVETNAMYLNLLCQVGHAKSDIARGVAKYLVTQRKHASYWEGTRDTALVVDALAGYVASTGEAKQELSVEVWLDGKPIKSVQISPKNLFHFDNHLRLEADQLPPGKHRIELRKTGATPLYVNAALSYFTFEDHIDEAGLDLRVQRRYYRINTAEKQIDAEDDRGQIVEYSMSRENREAIESGTSVSVGDTIEVEMIIESKNDFSYLSVVDRKPAGFETMELHSGHRWLGGISAYMQLRDAHTEFLIQRIARGRHRLAYRLRAETEGSFRGLPGTVEAVYAPELKANSESWQMHITP